MARIANESIPDLVYTTIQALTQNGKLTLILADLYAELRSQYWDIDDNDLHHAMGDLLARQKITLTIADQRIKIV